MRPTCRSWGSHLKSSAMGREQPSSAPSRCSSGCTMSRSSALAKPRPTATTTDAPARSTVFTTGSSRDGLELPRRRGHLSALDRRGRAAGLPVERAGREEAHGRGDGQRDRALGDAAVDGAGDARARRPRASPRRTCWRTTSRTPPPPVRPPHGRPARRRANTPSARSPAASSRAAAHTSPRSHGAGAVVDDQRVGEPAELRRRAARARRRRARAPRPSPTSATASTRPSAPASSRASERHAPQLRDGVGADHEPAGHHSTPSCRNASTSRAALSWTGPSSTMRLRSTAPDPQATRAGRRRQFRRTPRPGRRRSAAPWPRGRTSPS